MVLHRRDVAIIAWRSWLQEDPLIHPYKGLRPDLVPPAPFLQCQPHLTPGGSGVLADPARNDGKFRKAWLPYFCRSGQRETSLEEFNDEVEGWLPLLPEVSLPLLTGEMLPDVIRRKGVTAGSWMDGVGESSRFCLLPGMMGWRVFLPSLRRMGLAGGFAGCLYCHDSLD